MVLCDTTGDAEPALVEAVVEAIVAAGLPAASLGAHFHDTHGRALANVAAALGAGVTSFDGSLGGLGGCPAAPSAGGNVGTESLVALLDARGQRTGIGRDGLNVARDALARLVGRDLRLAARSARAEESGAESA